MYSGSSTITNAPRNLISLEPALHAEIVTNQLNVAFLACILWELIITVDQSIETFWKDDRWTISKFLFYFNRINSIFVMATHTLQFIVPSVSDRFCNSLLWIELAGTSSLIAVINYILLSRVYALWNLSRYIFVVCVCAFILDVGSYIGVSAYVIAIADATGAAPPLTGCRLASSHGYTYVFAILMVFEAAIVFMIVFKSYPTIRVQGVKAPLYSLLFGDGVAFYSAILVAHLLVLVSLLSPSMATLPIIESCPPMLVMGVACNRLLLRSQRLLQSRGSELPTLSTTFNLPTAAGTLEFCNQDDSHLSSSSMGEGLELVTTREEKVQTQAKTSEIESDDPPAPSLETHQEGRHRSISRTSACKA